MTTDFIYECNPLARELVLLQH